MCAIKAKQPSSNFSYISLVVYYKNYITFYISLKYIILTNNK
jgi:hypothetical protein